MDRSRTPPAQHSCPLKQLLDLPYEILIAIFRNLEYYDHKRLERTCRQINGIIINDNATYRAIQYRYPVLLNKIWTPELPLEPTPRMLHPYFCDTLPDCLAKLYTGRWGVRFELSLHVTLDCIIPETNDDGTLEKLLKTTLPERTKQEFASCPAPQRIAFYPIGNPRGSLFELRAFYPMGHLRMPTLELRRANGVKVADVLVGLAAWEREMRVNRIPGDICFNFV